MSDKVPFKLWFDKKSGEFLSQGTMPKSFPADLMKLMPKIEKIIEEEKFRKSLDRSGETKGKGKSGKTKVKKKSVAPKFPMSNLRKTKVSYGWVPQGEYVAIAGRKIPGMVYICDSESMGKAERRKHAESRIWIDVAKCVSGRDKKGFYLNASHYSEMEPANRASYLDWLANGRKDTDFHPHYVKTYFFGLEHRLLCDGISSSESQQIRNELERLKAVFSDYEYGKFRKQMDDLLKYDGVVSGTATAKTRGLVNYFDLPVGLQVEIGEAISEGRGLTGKQVFGWYYNSDRSCNYDSDTLFAIKDEFLKEFSKSFPEGMRVKPTAKVLNAQYGSVSNEFRVSEAIKVNGRPVMDIGSMKNPLIRAEELVDRICKDSTVSKEGRTGRTVPFAKSKKKELHVHIPEKRNSPKGSDFVAWAGKLAKGQIPTTWGELLEKLEGKRPKVFGYTRWWDVLEELVVLGFDAAPDHLLFTGNQKLNDPLILFESDGIYARNSKGHFYSDDLLVHLGLGAYLYSSTGLDSKDAKKKLQALVLDSGALVGKCNESDMAAVHANIEYLLLRPTDDKFIRNLRKNSSNAKTDKLRSSVIEIAGKLDIAQAKTVSAVEKIYKMFKLDPNLAYSDLHAGEYVPKASKKTAKAKKPAKLDEALIESIRMDTEKVSNVLGSIFSEEGKQEADAAKVGKSEKKLKSGRKAKTASGSTADGKVKSNGKAKATVKRKANGKSANKAKLNGKAIQSSKANVNGGSAYPGLDDKHACFMGEIVQKSYWSEKAFAKLAEKHGLMPGGVTETINEWVFERYDDVLLDEHEGFHVTAAIADSMKSESERNGN